MYGLMSVFCMGLFGEQLVLVGQALAAFLPHRLSPPSIGYCLCVSSSRGVMSGLDVLPVSGCLALVVPSRVVYLVCVWAENVFFLRLFLSSWVCAPPACPRARNPGAGWSFLPRFLCK